MHTLVKPMMKGIQQQRRTYYGSLDYTIIAIEADESTPLLVGRVIWPEDNNNNKIIVKNEKPAARYGLPYWPIGSSSQSSGSTCSFNSTKSFKSHFLELKVFTFAFILSVAISIAIYLLIIESRLPSITLSLDLVSRDIWNTKIIPKQHYLRLQHENVDHIILMQTGNRNCDTPDDCLEVLKEMQNNEPEELPFNFLIGGDGLTYEVRGWKYQSGKIGIPQEQSLVIGVIGNFNQTAPKNKILSSVNSLIKLSSKRKMINTKYYIYGFLQSYRDLREGQQFFDELKKWSEFKGFLTNY